MPVEGLINSCRRMNEFLEDEGIPVEG